MLSAKDHASAGWRRSVKGSPTDSGRLRKIQSLQSKMNLSTAARSPAATRERAWASDSRPAACMVRMVSAQTMPDGKRSCSALMRLRLRGMAATTPSTEMARSHAVSCRPVSSGMSMTCSRRSMVSAGMELTRPAEDMYAAADAAVCEVLFSSMVNSAMRGNSLRSEAKIANASTLAVMDMPKFQPILRPM